MCSNRALSDDTYKLRCFATRKNSKFSNLTTCIVMLLCEPVYGTYTDVIKPPSYVMEVNMAPGTNETKNTKIQFGTKSKLHKF